MYTRFQIKSVKSAVGNVRYIQRVISRAIRRIRLHLKYRNGFTINDNGDVRTLVNRLTLAFYH